MKLKVFLSAVLMAMAGGITAQEMTVENMELEKSTLSLVNPIQNIEVTENEENRILPLSSYFTASENLTFEAEILSRETLVNISLNGEQLEIDFLNAGQASIWVKASNESTSVSDTFLVGIRPEINEFEEKIDFEVFDIEDDQYWNGSDESGGFFSGSAFFPNEYNSEWMSWSGWAISNTSDIQTPGFMNQYSAISPVRLDSTRGTQYGVSYLSFGSEINFPDSSLRQIAGFFICNTTYAAKSMSHGDDYTKKFGGNTGNDPDWFKLKIEGYAHNSLTDSISFYLADFRSENNQEDYIIETWQWVDLTSLGLVSTLKFHLSSSDNGDFGMNTPAFISMDNLYISDVLGKRNNKAARLLPYPNPGKGIYQFNSINDIEELKVYDSAGKVVFYRSRLAGGESIDLTEHGSGIYIIRALIDNQIYTDKIIIQK